MPQRPTTPDAANRSPTIALRRQRGSANNCPKLAFFALPSAAACFQTSGSRSLLATITARSEGRIPMLKSRTPVVAAQLLPAIESNYTPTATSHAGAAGIWQFVRSTGRLYGLEQTTWYDARRDLVASTDAALDYLDYLADYFGDDWEVALAAYSIALAEMDRVAGAEVVRD